VSRKSRNNKARDTPPSSGSTAGSTSLRRKLLIAVLIAAGLFAAWLVWPAAIGYVILPAGAHGTLAMVAAVGPLLACALPLALRALRARKWMLAFWVVALAPVTVLLNLMALSLLRHFTGGPPLQLLPILVLTAAWLAFGLFAKGPALVSLPPKEGNMPGGDLKAK